MPGSSDLLLDGQMSEEGFDFKNRPVLRVTFVVKKEVANPVDIALLGAIGGMFEADGIAHWVEQLSGLCLYILFVLLY